MMTNLINKHVDLKKINRSTVILFLGMIIQVGFYLYRSNEQFMPVILMDEFGYWSNAAHFTGSDWSAISAHNSYYSYGYSLLLAAIMKAFCGYAAYKAALFANLVISIFMLIVHYRILVQLFPNMRSINAAIVAVLVQMYPSNSGNIHIAWAELYLTFFFSLSVYFLLLFISKRKSVFLYLWILICVYLYMIHQRALGVLLAAFLLVIFMAYKNEIDVKHVIIIMLLFGVCMVGHRYIKNDILSSVIVSEKNTNAAVNDYPSVLAHLKDNFDFSGLKRLLISFSGKLAYLLLATLGTFHLFAKNTKEELFSNRDRNKKYCYVYLTMVTAFEIGIVAIFTLRANRLESIFYGRYIEWFFQPVIMICFMYLQERNLKKELLKAAIAVLAVCIYITYIFSSTAPENTYFFVCLQALYVFYEQMGDSYIILTGAVLGGWLILLSRIGKRIQLACCAITLFLGLFYADVVCINRTLDSNYRSDIVREMDEIISDNNDPEVAFINDDSQLIWYVADLQVYSKDRVVKEIDSVSDNSDVYEGFVLVNPESEEGKYISSLGADPLVANWQVALYRISNE